ncbi:hypothetical protein RFF05_00885 [Bengtsoniella intestinalis]|uniref:hypothetical protein n=1 Tax=Bengtsoniella intestinalis TaxID=3073143 RepID=UPI00391FBC21
MAEKIMPGPVDESCPVREAVCIHTKKVFDSCRDKDCIEDLRFYPKFGCVDVLNHAMSVKGGTAKLLYVYVDVEPVTFNRGFFTIDMRFFYDVTLQAYLNSPCPVPVEGLCVFDKRVILFGSEGNAKIFTSSMQECACDTTTKSSNKPQAVVEAVDPIVLDARLVDNCARRECDCDLCEVPTCVNQFFNGELVNGDEGRRVYVTLGQFSIVRLERDAQLLIPVYDYCMPDKECNGSGGGSEDPCSIFRNICFPVGEFFPPNTVRTPDTYEETKSFCGCH